LVLEDPFAVPILGETYRSALEQADLSLNEPFSSALRAWVVARSRYAEDKLAQAVSEGVQQYVVLGAGLDTFAHRNPYAELSVFEVDHPSTQNWKRNLLRSNSIPEPPTVHYVPVDFETQTLADSLQAGGLDLTAPTVFSWLGVVMYLSPQAFRATLDFISRFPAPSGVILDYALPRHVLRPQEQLARDLLAARVQEAGEPFQLFFTRFEIAAELSAFRVVEDLGTEELNSRYFDARQDRLVVAGRSGRILSAWK
jgi:methyltransferase (TIGR00027 family)